MAQDSHGQKSGLAPTAASGSPAEMLSGAIARAKRGVSPAQARKSICALILFCDIPEQKPQEDAASKYRIDSAMAQFMRSQAERSSVAMLPGRRYLILYSKTGGRLAGPVGEAGLCEEPAKAASRIARETLMLTGKEAESICAACSFTGENTGLSSFALGLPYERLAELITAINRTSPKCPGMEDFFFAALVRPDYFRGESMSGVYQGRFMDILESANLLQKPQL